MNGIDAVIDRLREHNEPVPKPFSLPSKEEIQAYERELQTDFQPDFRTYLFKASDVVFGSIEPATITEPQSHTHLPKIIKSARESGVPDRLFPFCEDNGDFYCLAPTGEVVYWSHDGASNERWPSFADWIERVWIEENL